MEKIKSIFMDLLYNIIWVRIEYLFILWAAGIFFIVLAGLDERACHMYEKFLSTEEYNIVEGKIAGIEIYEDRPGFGSRESYVSIKLQEGSEFYEMPAMLHKYDWEELAKKLQSGNEVKLFTYCLSNENSLEPKFVAVFSNEKEIISVKDVKEICEKYNSKAAKNMKLEVMLGIIALGLALVITISRKL